MTADNAEIELKLAVATPAELDRVRAAPALSGVAGSRRHLDSVYYDTPDMRLQRRGVGLRVRRVGNRYIQTVKTESGNGSGVRHRGEWQAPVASMEPDLEAISDPEMRAWMATLHRDQLRPVFATRIERETRLVDGGGPEDAGRAVEVALDRGVIEAADRTLPVHEVELELLRGAPATLYRLALELHESAPLRVESQSKAARGYALALDRPPQVRYGAAIGLDAQTTVDDAIAAVVRGCFAHWTANEAAAVDGRDPEGVHQMRVGLRRLRSVMALFGGVVPEGQRRWVDDEATTVLAALAPARDLDVFLAEVAAPVAAERGPDGRLDALVDAATSARAAAYRGVAQALAAPRYTAFVLRFGLWLEERGWREAPAGEADDRLHQPLVGLADLLLAKRHKTVLKRGKDFAAQTAAERHRLRIAVKKLRYAAEFFSGVYAGKRRKRYRQALAELQDHLGRRNDVAVAEALIDRLVAGAGGGERGQALRESGAMVLGWHARGLIDDEPDLRRAWRAFAARKPFWHRPKA